MALTIPGNRRSASWPLDRIHRMGVGLGYRPEIARDIMRHHSEIEVLEILADRVIRGGRREWDEIRDLSKIIPLIPHGVNLSIGSVDCLKSSEYLKTLKRLTRWMACPYYSDHFALTKVRGADIGHLTPLWRTREQLDVVVSNTLAMQKRIQKPLVLETITIPFEIPGFEMSATQFINEATERTGCGLLLDLANIFINGANHGFDPAGFLESLNLAAVVQIHLAGGIRNGGAWIDSHSERVHPAVWKLLKAYAPRLPNLKAIIIERDSHFVDFKALLAEVRKAKAIWESA